jgi:hypothetical protein
MRTTEGVLVRWDALFDDLEAELEAAEATDLDLELRDRVRTEVARLRLRDRLCAALGHDVTAYVDGAGTLQGQLTGCGVDWLLLREGPGRDVLVPYAALLGLTGLGRRSAEPGSEGKVGARLDLAHALRGLARGRLPCAVVGRDGGVAHGTLDRVGADFVELAEHPAGEPRRPDAVRQVRTIPTTAIAAIRSA